MSATSISRANSWKPLSELARNKLFLGVIVIVAAMLFATILILVGCFGVSLKTPYFEISVPAQRALAPARTTSTQERKPASTKPSDIRPDSAQNPAGPTVSTSPPIGESVRHTAPATPSVLLVPIGSTLTDSLTQLRGRKFTRGRVQGGELIRFHQNVFGLDWAVSELLMNETVVSATLTKSLFAEGREGTPTWSESILDPVSAFCFGTGYQSLRDMLDTSMQIVSGQLDDERPARLDISLFRPCPDGKNCNMEWTTRYGQWIYHAPGVREVTLSVDKSDYSQYEFAQAGYDRTVLHRQRCELRLTFSGQNAPTTVPLSMLP